LSVDEQMPGSDRIIAFRIRFLSRFPQRNREEIVKILCLEAGTRPPSSV
jgi:hypothetical protein